MSELVLTPAEQAFLRALHELGVPFLLVGMGAGRPKDLAQIPLLEAALAVRDEDASR